MDDEAVPQNVFLSDLLNKGITFVKEYAKLFSLLGIVAILGIGLLHYTKASDVDVVVNFRRLDKIIGSRDGCAESINFVQDIIANPRYKKRYGMQAVQYFVDLGLIDKALICFGKVANGSPQAKFSEIALLVEKNNLAAAQNKNSILLKELKNSKLPELLFFSLQQRRSYH